MPGDLNELIVFVRVAETGSFTAAARALGLPKSTVSRRIADLETRLGVRLLHRTTRRLSLTDGGRTFFQDCHRIVQDLAAAELAVSRLGREPRGQLRVTAPLNMEFLAPIVADFLRRYPEVELSLLCTDRVVNLVDEGLDLALRAGPVADHALVGRALGKMTSSLVASPGYLDLRGRPEQPAELAGHAALVFSSGVQRTWRLCSRGKTLDVVVPPRLRANDYHVLVAAAVSGLGIALLPEYLSSAALNQHQLERVLPDWAAPEVRFHALYPSTRQLAPAVRAFLDTLAGTLEPTPWR